MAGQSFSIKTAERETDSVSFLVHQPKQSNQGELMKSKVQSAATELYGQFSRVRSVVVRLLSCGFIAALVVSAAAAGAGRVPKASAVRLPGLTDGARITR